MVTSATLHTPFHIGVPSTVSTCVLLVEDDASVQQLERLILEEHGYQVEVANNGEEALDALGEAAPDLILLDVELGGIDGFTTCQRIRQISEVPILIVSSKDSIGDKIWGLEVGADDYLIKPFHPDELAARVKAILRRPRLGNGEIEFALPKTLPSVTEKLLTIIGNSNLVAVLFQNQLFQLLNTSVIFYQQHTSTYGGRNADLEGCM